MTNPTITSSTDLNFYSSGSKTLTFYNVQSEDIRKSAGLIDLPMPTLDSNGKIVMDLMGASREIRIDGIVTINDLSDSQLFKYAQDIAGLKSSTYNSLINGGQGTSSQYTYYSMTISGNINVCVSESSVKYEMGSSNKIAYSVTMMEFGTLV